MPNEDPQADPDTHVSQVPSALRGARNRTGFTSDHFSNPLSLGASKRIYSSLSTMLFSNALMPFEITVAKIKLTLGRNYHNTFYHGVMTGRKCLRGTGG